ncbi:MAG: hopanoid-associated sugar epimerase [Acidimicrobiales bacterium]|jgi:dihydroflavonol-4-reductase
MAIKPGDRVLVTGADGFIGSAVTRALLARGAELVALLQPGVPHSNLDGLAVEPVVADLRDRPAVLAAAEGCRMIFHVAAIYRFWVRDAADFYEVNVGGSLNVINAARAAGVERVVYTSTVGTIGLDGTDHDRAADETAWARISHLFGLYKQSKYVAEHEVLRAAAEGLPVVLVQPTLPLGPGDRAPTPTGKTVLDFLNGRIPGWFDTALNVVDVDDVAAGHVLAAERGAQGRSYVLGGENLELRQILDVLAEATGLPRAAVRVPRRVALVAGHASGLVEGRLLRREPSIPLEGARMATTRMVFNDARARRELGYSSRPAVEAIVRSARWYADNGYVSAKRLARIRWRDVTGLPPGGHIPGQAAATAFDRAPKGSA